MQEKVFVRNPNLTQASYKSYFRGTRGIPKGPIDARKLCMELTQAFAISDGGFFDCDMQENYGIAFMTEALHMMGYESKEEYTTYAQTGTQATKSLTQGLLDMQAMKPNEVFLINLGGYHWTAFIRRGSEFVYLDSILPRPLVSQSPKNIVPLSKIQYMYKFQNTKKPISVFKDKQTMLNV